MKKKKLSLRSSSERGNKQIIFIDRDLLITFTGDVCYRSIDYQLNNSYLDKFILSEYGNLEFILVHHAKELALSHQTLDQLDKIDQTLKELIKTKSNKLLDQLNCIHHEDADGNEALSVSCSCHPRKGGLFLDAAVKYSLSLSQCHYLSMKDQFAEVAKGFGISILKIDNI